MRFFQQKNKPPTSKRTVYDGIEFRSRIEARWAHLFNEMGVDWRYEPETIRGRGRAYLPDFLLDNVAFMPIIDRVSPTAGWHPLYFEIKHREYVPTAADHQKWRNMRGRTHRFAVAFGLGYADGSGVYDDQSMRILTYLKRGDVSNAPMAFYKCPNGHIWLEYYEADGCPCHRCGEHGDTYAYDQAYVSAARTHYGD